MKTLFLSLWILTCLSVSSRAQSSQELIQNGNFENDPLDPWIACGAVLGVEPGLQNLPAWAVRSGKRSIALVTANPQNVCGPHLGFLSQTISIPASAPTLTVQFWYNCPTPINWNPAFGIPFMMTLESLNPDGSITVIPIASIDPRTPPGWTLFRKVLSHEELSRLRGRQATLHFIHHTSQSPTYRDLLIDDVSIVTADQRVKPSPLPPALRGDRTRPIVYVNGATLARMDSDGGFSGGILGMQGQLIQFPIWSNSGQHIAFAASQPYGLNAQAHVLISDPDGNLAYAPPGQIVPFHSLVYKQCALDITGNRLSSSYEYNRIAWAPDDSQLAVSYYEHATSQHCLPLDTDLSKYYWGVHSLSDLVHLPSGSANRLFSQGAELSWSSGGLLGKFTGLEKIGYPPGLGIVHFASPDARSQHHFLPQQPNFGDTWPTWSPDAKRFAVLRHSPATTGPQFPPSILLYPLEAPDALANPKMLLLADHGIGLGPFCWSPDSRFILYTLFTPNNRSDIWWLDVESGATGPLTSDGISHSPSWRPTHRLIQPPAAEESTLSVRRVGRQIEVRWDPRTQPGTLQTSKSPTGPWTPVPVASLTSANGQNAYQTTSDSGAAFFRLVK